MAKYEKFPDDSSLERLRRYSSYEKLLIGEHYSSYIKQMGDTFSEKYQYLRYITCNFAGLLSKVISDVLFGEKVSIEGNDKEQGFIDSLIKENQLYVQLYESSLMNSARGDALLRIGARDSNIYIQDINPAMYYPVIGDNYREAPKEAIIAHKREVGNDTYLIKENYVIGSIFTTIHLMKDSTAQEIVKNISVKEYNELTGENLEEVVLTGIDEIPLVHVPNFRLNNNFWGTSDYHDLESLFFAVNNRITKTDNILDKHSDPILAVPEGVLDEDGNVQKSSLGMVEVRGGEGKPEYIVWNANLESAFAEIDKLIEMIFLFGEVSPDVVGIDKGRTGAESGRALKLRMLRTLAKKNRKALYYEQAIKSAIRIASKFANTGMKSNGVAYKGQPIDALVTFADGVIDDKVEDIQNQSLLYQSGLTTQMRAVKSIHDLEDVEAEELVEEIKEEKKSGADFNSDEIFHLKQNELQAGNKEGVAV